MYNILIELSPLAFKILIMLIGIFVLSFKINAQTTGGFSYVTDNVNKSGIIRKNISPFDTNAVFKFNYCQLWTDTFRIRAASRALRLTSTSDTVGIVVANDTGGIRSIKKSDIRFSISNITGLRDTLNTIWGSITANTNNIATNTSNIATNTSNISSLTTSVTGKKDKSDSVGVSGYTTLFQYNKGKDSVVSLLANYLTTSAAAATYQPIGTYATASNTMTFTNKSGNISQWTNDAGYLTTASISGKLNISDSVGNTGYVQLWRLNKVRDSLQTNINTKQATISLTTTGTSGVATFVSNTLNIPNYSFTYSAPSVNNAITSGTAFQPNASKPCNILINTNVSGLVGVGSTVVIAMSSTSGGTYSTVANDAVSISILTLGDKASGMISVPQGYWVKVTYTAVGLATVTGNYTRWDIN